MKLNRIQLVVMFLTVFVSFCFVNKAIASELFFDKENFKFENGKEYSVDLFLETNGETINAIGGVISYPDNLLELVRVNDGGSVVTLWIENNIREGEFSFSGVIPGGFEGTLTPYGVELQPGKIITLIFKVKGFGSSDIIIGNTKVLLHDGRGTPDVVNVRNANFEIREDVINIRSEIGDVDFMLEEEFEEELEEVLLVDKKSPEKFTVQVAQNEYLFDGQWVLVFSTQDKGSGMSHFEVKEGDGDFVVVSSPYLVKNQKLKDEIIVKAVDNAGNETIVLALSEPVNKYYQYFYIYGIIILIIISLIVVLTRRKR